MNRSKRKKKKKPEDINYLFPASKPAVEIALDSLESETSYAKGYDKGFKKGASYASISLAESQFQIESDPPFWKDKAGKQPRAVTKATEISQVKRVLTNANVDTQKIEGLEEVLLRQFPGDDYDFTGEKKKSKTPVKFTIKKVLTQKGKDLMKVAGFQLKP
jgi:hypothetical protein